MSNSSKSWLQLYVDAMMEKDPFKRLSLVRELNGLPKEDDSGEVFEQQAVRPRKKSKTAPRR
jgi:hypothetical protein